MCLFIWEFGYSCSSADEDNEDPSTKAHREKERRQANNVRERYVETYIHYFTIYFFKSVFVHNV